MITAGELLKKKRESLGKNLDTVSLDTKIQKRFIQYIERNEYSKFDSEVFLTGFIKIYSQYLGLDVDKILALYRRSRPVQVKDEKKKNTVKKSFRSTIITPRFIITASIILFFLSILTYIGIQIYKFQSPPRLTISEPVQDSVVQTDKINIKGTTDSKASVEINGIKIDLDPNGNFQKELQLNEGVNLITIKSRKNNNNILETVETRKVTYNKPQQQTQTEQPIKTNTLTLEVKDSSAWVRLDIDDENEIAKVIQPTKNQYTVKNKFYIITGRVKNTFAYFNGEPLAWKTNSSTGVAEIKCDIINNTLNCQ